MIVRALQGIYRINLGVKRQERVLVFNDTPSPAEEDIAYDDLCRRTRLRDITLLTAEVGKAFARRVLYYEFPATGSHGAEPPAGLWECAFGEKTVVALRKAKLLSPLLKKKIPDAGLRKAEEIIAHHKKYAVDAVIALSNYSTSHTRFRDLLTRVCGCRYASMPLFDASMLEGAMNTEWRTLAKRTTALAREVNRAESVEIHTSNGTRITLSKRGRKALADTGILTKKGAFGNLPAGEVFFAPREGTAEGTLVLEWAPTRELRSPLTLTVRNGIVQDIAGDEPFGDLLRAKLGEKRENGNIAELGIGTNDRARRPDSILETEKILGTVHIALGDNSSFGGIVKTPFHQDFIFFRPTVVLTLKDGSKRELLREGTVPFPPDLK
ncbi:MAG: aminopeptidase [Alphaproteobacteria bacterium]|uniref:Aminopeptidase n=1 Tax=Candidatus Nitrobium versatile TaxID=2884831 RepID=A0A953J690_9BACT|nr:aminopeptidase [Candidatus Nitrobium versatile]